MAEMSTPMVEITKIEDHPNADRLDITHVLGYQCVVAKGNWSEGNRGLYIPEGALVPDWLLKKYKFWDEDKNKGMLAGKQGNRVKAIRLRGVVSQGIILPLIRIPYVDHFHLEVDDNIRLTIAEDADFSEVARLLGIEKYDPPIPTQMAGDVVGASGHTVKFDVESLQRYPNAIQEGEQVTATEKLHGTFIDIGFDPSIDNDDFYRGGTIITSKGLGARGLAFKNANVVEHNPDNLYVKTWRKEFLDTGIWDDTVDKCIKDDMVIHFLGEVHGLGVQDLGYGEKDPTIRIFALLKRKKNESYIDYKVASYSSMFNFCNAIDLKVVPLLYEGPFDLETVTELRDGDSELLSGQIREGIVLSPADKGFRSYVDFERWEDNAFLKLVSPDYLTRKGGTEFE